MFRVKLPFTASVPRKLHTPGLLVQWRAIFTVNKSCPQVRPKIAHALVEWTRRFKLGKLIIIAEPGAVAFDGREPQDDRTTPHHAAVAAVAKFATTTITDRPVYYGFVDSTRGNDGVEADAGLGYIAWMQLTHQLVLARSVLLIADDAEVSL